MIFAKEKFYSFEPRHCYPCINIQMCSNMQSSTPLLFALWRASYVEDHDVFVILPKLQHVVASTEQS